MRLSRDRITKILMDQDCTKCPFDADCSGDTGCAVKLLAAKLLCEDVICIRSLNRKLEAMAKGKKKPVKTKPRAKKPIEIEWHDSDGDVCKVAIHGYMPWNMGHFLATRIRADMSSKPYRGCFFCNHSFELAEVPVGITVHGIGNRFACSKCYEKVKGDG